MLQAQFLQARKGLRQGEIRELQARELRAWKVECQWLIGCRQVGQAKFDMAKIRYTENGSRDILEVTYLGNWRPSGDMNGISLRMDTTCTVTMGGGSCKAVIEALTVPASTGELAAEVDVTPGAISQHVSVLRECDLVTSRRAGRRVIHSLTQTGEALVRGAEYPWGRTV